MSGDTVVTPGTTLKPMTYAEFKASLDKDNNGVQKGELLEAQAQSKLTKGGPLGALTNEEAEAEFTQMDASKDGTVGEAEFTAYQAAKSTGYAGPPIYLYINNQPYILAAGKDWLEQPPLIEGLEVEPGTEKLPQLQQAAKHLRTSWTIIWEGVQFQDPGMQQPMRLIVMPGAVINADPLIDPGTPETFTSRFFGKRDPATLKDPAGNPAANGWTSFEAAQKEGGTAFKGHQVDGGWVVKGEDGKLYLLLNEDSYIDIFGFTTAEIASIEANHPNGIKTDKGVLVEILPKKGEQYGEWMQDMIRAARRYEMSGEGFVDASSHEKVEYLDPSLLGEAIFGRGADMGRKYTLFYQQYLGFVIGKEPQVYRGLLEQAKQMASLDARIGQDPKALGDPSKTQKFLLEIIAQRIMEQLRKQRIEAGEIDWNNAKVWDALLWKDPKDAKSMSVFEKFLRTGILGREDIGLLIAVSKGEKEPPGKFDLEAFDLSKSIGTIVPGAQ
jgi:hypothetical protein